MTTGDDRGGDWAAPGSSTPPPGWSTDQPPPTPTSPPPPPPPGWATGPAAYYPQSSYAPPPPRPGIVPLRPLGVGELLDGAFTAIRRHPRTLLGMAAVVMVVVETVRVATAYSLLSGVAAPTADAPSSE